MSDATVVIAAGGTGGHVFPALAVAKGLRERDISVVWVGTEAGLEHRLVPAHGFLLKHINVSPLRGGWRRKPLGLINLVKAIRSSTRILKQEKAGTVLGMGGYVSGPVCLAAKLTGCRLVVHEQNAVPGFTNRILKLLANKALQAMPNAFKDDEKVICTGNPIRSELLTIDAPATRYNSRQGPLRILVVGGSQGARALNQKVPKALALIDDPIDVIHQCGSSWYEETKSNYNGLPHKCDVREFIDDMAEVYSWADVIICRAGAMTVAEVAAVGVASILVPYPAAVDDHQTANGAFLVESDAAVMMQESELSPNTLFDLLNTFDRETLTSMAVNARAVSKRDATARVIAELTGAAV